MFKGKNYIDGKFCDQVGSNFTAINPSTEEVYGEFPLSLSDVVTEAVKVARKAQIYWSTTSRIYRADLFDKLAHILKGNHAKIRDAISIETGKNLNESHAEVIEMLHMCQVVAGSGRQPCGEIYASELPTKDAYTIRKPRGVVAIVSPWNFPLLGSFWSAAPALVEGNTVVHKPSELTPMVNQLVAELYGEAGFPDGVYNLIHGDGTTGAALVRSDVNTILFTGSAEVAQDIRRHCAECHNKTYSIECGSKSAMMVFADGNMDLALDACIASAFKLSGQRCVSTGRILIQKDVYNEFRDKFVDRAKKLETGDPFLGINWAFYGPLISEEHLHRVISFNQLTFQDSNTNVLLAGKRIHNKGYFLTPHVYEAIWRVSADKGFLKQEVFGPHVALVPFDTLDNAVEYYNDTEYGLSLGIVTDDFRKHREIIQRCTAGMIYINGGSVGAESHLPFSSWKKSGYGSSAAATYKAVTHTTAVTINYESGKVTWAQGLK